MRFVIQPVSAILPTLPTVTNPSDLMHGTIGFFSTWIAHIGSIPPCITNARPLQRLLLDYSVFRIVFCQ